MKRIARDAQIIDITHGIAPQAVTQGALVLARAVPYLPAGGPPRRGRPGRRQRAPRGRDPDGATAASTSAPTTGCSTLAADARRDRGRRGSLTNPRYHLEHVSRTFHARDVFAPVAAHLAAGADFDDLGDEVDPATLVRIDLPEPRSSSGELARDHARRRPLRQPRAQRLEREHRRARRSSRGDRVELASRSTPYYAVVGETYADAGRGELILYEDSYGACAIAISGGNAGGADRGRPGRRGPRSGRPSG